MKKKQPKMVTFKADPTLLEAMKGVPNRSEFIRDALLTALQNVCPLCKGTGILTPNQKRHWEAFSVDHNIRECADCHELGLVCLHKPKRKLHRLAR